MSEYERILDTMKGRMIRFMKMKAHFLHVLFLATGLIIGITATAVCLPARADDSRTDAYKATPESSAVEFTRLCAQPLTDAAYPHIVCDIPGCKRTDSHKHPICTVADCTETCAHAHNGVYCYAHTVGDGHAYHTCGVSGCTLAETHQHCNAFPGCTRTDSHEHCSVEGCTLTGAHEHCSVAGCTLTGSHEHCSIAGCAQIGPQSHNSCGVNGCNIMENHSHHNAGSSGHHSGHGRHH